MKLHKCIVWCHEGLEHSNRKIEDDLMSSEKDRVRRRHARHQEMRSERTRNDRDMKSL